MMETTTIKKCAIVVMQGRLGRFASGVHYTTRHLQTHFWFCGITARSGLSPSNQSGVHARHTSCAGFKFNTINKLFIKLKNKKRKTKWLKIVKTNKKYKFRNKYLTK